MSAILPRKVIARLNSGSDLTRRRLNLIAGTNVTLTLTDDSADDEIELTIAASSGSTIDRLTTYDEFDDFTSGGTASAQVGKLGWSVQGTAAAQANETNHPGIMRVTSSASANGIGALGLRASTTVGVLDYAESFDHIFVFRANSTVNVSRYRVGLWLDVTADPASNGIYLESLSTDTNWFFVTRSGGSQTRVDTGVARDTTSWLKIRIRRIDGTHIGFTLNAGAESSFTATIPTGLYVPIYQVATTEAVAKTLDADLAKLGVTGLTR